VDKSEDAYRPVRLSAGLGVIVAIRSVVSLSQFEHGIQPAMDADQRGHLPNCKHGPVRNLGGGYRVQARSLPSLLLLPDIPSTR